MPPPHEYSDRHAAEHAGVKKGQSYAYMIIIVLFFMAYQQLLPWSGFTTMLLSAAIFIAMRMQYEQQYGAEWDRYHR